MSEFALKYQVLPYLPFFRLTPADRGQAKNV